MKQSIRMLLLGDIVGNPGVAMFQKHVASLKKLHKIDGIIVNGENSAVNGRGITPPIVQRLKEAGADIITSGNHIYNNKEIYQYLAENKDLLRPANFPSSCPGVGVTTFMCKGYKVGVINVQGRVFMRELLECPFKTTLSLLTFLRSQTQCIIVDFHAETTAEKAAFAYYFDGKVSAIVGTHTHVQTADERILPGGTAYITDLGMAGALHSSIGMKKEPIIEQFLTQMPQKFIVDTQGPMVLSGIWVELDVHSGKATHIERIRIIDNDIASQDGV
jgi:2',3'-cyclic-nucleotide 2'-phosphodiesterase